MGEGNELSDDSTLANSFNQVRASFKDVHSSKNLGDELKEGMYASDSKKKMLLSLRTQWGHVEPENEKKCIYSHTTEACLPNDCNKMPLEGQSTLENDLTGKLLELQTPMQNSASQPPQVSECAISIHGVRALFRSWLFHYVAVPLVSVACSLCCPSLQPHCSHFSCSGIANANAATDLVYSTSRMTENNGAIKGSIQAAESMKNQMRVASSSKDNVEKGENDMSSKESDQADLMMVLNASYTSGFHTDRYLEQSKKNACRGS